MVANAGIMVMKNIFDISVEEWDKLQAVRQLITPDLNLKELTMSQVNVRGVFLCYREAGDFLTPFLVPQ